jgi:hypothetical protein
LWSYSSWIYNYLCNQCLSPLTLWARTQFMARSTQYNIMWWSLSVTCDMSAVFSWYSIQHYVMKFVSDLQHVGGFHQVILVSSTNKSDLHDITEILLKVELNTINQPNQLHPYFHSTIWWLNKNVDFEFNAHDNISGIIFIRYTPNQKAGKPNDLI